MEEILQELIPVMKKEFPRRPPTNEKLYEYFLTRTRANLHVVLCFSPVSTHCCQGVEWLKINPKETLKIDRNLDINCLSNNSHIICSWMNGYRLLDSLHLTTNDQEQNYSQPTLQKVEIILFRNPVVCTISFKKNPKISFFIKIFENGRVFFCHHCIEKELFTFSFKFLNVKNQKDKSCVFKVTSTLCLWELNFPSCANVTQKVEPLLTSHCLVR